MDSSYNLDEKIDKEVREENSKEGYVQSLYEKDLSLNCIN